jgi:calcineurin-like phosphoesterase family protein
MIYFIADHHWGHKAIIWMENRPFKDVLEMNEFMINSWNSIITNDDEVYHLGDISYKMNPNQLKYKILPRLNGKIHLIRGNHDKDKIISKIGDRFESISDYKYLSYNYENKNYDFALFHYPITSWANRYRGCIHLHGHDHNFNNDEMEKNYFGNIMNVSVEHLNYIPISIVDVINNFKNKKLQK